MEREEHSEQPPTQPEETSTSQTQQTSQIPETPSTDTTGRALYLSVLQDKNREIDTLRQQLSQKQQEAAKPAPITPAQEQEFFANPVSTTRDLIKQELTEALAPFKGFIQQNQSETEYQRIKRTLRDNPVLGNLLKENESLVDQLMNGATVNENNVMAAIFQANGLKAAGLLNNQNQPITPQNTQASSQQPPVNQQPQNMSTPPHLRPTPPAAPRLDNAPPKRQFTENEKRLMREWGMTEDEYLAGQIKNEDNVGALTLEPETTASIKQKQTPKESVK